MTPPPPAGASLLASPTPTEASLLAPPAPSGGAWGDASPQTPAKKTLRRMVRRVLVSVVAVVDTAGLAVVDTAGLAVVDTAGLTARRDARRGCRQARRVEGNGDRRPFPMSKSHDPRDECMAGVWGEASPQAPPEARWTVGRSRGASQPWAGGARERLSEEVGGARSEAQPWVGRGGRPRLPRRRAPTPAAGGGLVSHGRGSEGLLYLISLLLPLLFFAPYLGGHIVPFGVDIVLLNYPLLTLVAHALRAGYPVLWNPFSGGGYPLAPFGALPFYPSTWLLALLPVTAAISWTYALDLAIGGLGAYALAARLGVRPAARLVPAIAYPFSGFILAHVLAGHFLEVGLMAWFPVALAALHWALDAASGRTALRRGVLCGGAFGMLVLANGVSWLIFVGYPLILVALVLSLCVIRAAGRRGTGIAPAALRCALALAAAGIAGLLISAVVLLPLQSLVGETLRGSGPMAFPRLTRTAEPLTGLVLAVAPGLFGSDVTGTYWFPNSDAYFQEVYTYLGLPVLALALAGVVAGRRRADIRLYAVLAALALALALGAQTPLYHLLYHLGPGFDVARTPARWMLVVTLAVAVLAGAGADALLGSVRREAGGGRRERSHGLRAKANSRPSPLAPRLSPLAPLAALALLLLLGLLGVAVAAALPLDHARAGAAALRGATLGPALARLLVVAAATALVVLAVPQLPRPTGAALLAVLVTADLWSANAPLIHPLDPAPYYRNAAVTLVQGREGAGRVWSLDRAVPLRLGMLDRRTLDIEDFAPLTLSGYYLFTHPTKTLGQIDTGMARADDIAPYNSRIAAVLGVSTVLSRRPLSDPSLSPLGVVRVPYYGVLRGDWSHPGARPGPAYAYSVTARLPFALPLYATRAIQPGQARAAVFAPGFDPRRVALLDGAHTETAVSNPLLDAWRRFLRPPAGQPAQVGPDVTRLGGAENGVTLRVTMRRTGVLLLDQVYDKDWTATVRDETPGKPGAYAVALRRADGLLTALPLAAGTHTVTLVYAPPSYLLGAILSLLGSLLVLGAALTGARRRGTPTRGAPPAGG